MRRRTRYSDLPIRLKLLAPFVVLMIIWGGFGSYVLARGSAGEARGRATARLAESLDAARAAFTTLERSQIETVRLASHTQGVAKAVASRDEAAIRRLVLPIAVNSSHELLEVVERGGAVLLRIDTAGAKPQVASGGTLEVAAVARAARGESDGRGDKWSALAGDAFLVAGPVRDGSGRAVGAVVVSERLTGVVSQMAQGRQSQIVLFDRSGRRLSASGALALPYHDAHDGFRTSASVGGESYEALYAPLEARGDRVGALAVALPAGVALGGVGRAAGSLALLVGLAVIAAVGIGLATARAITRPLDSLLGATRSLERGQMGARARIGSADEVGTLAVAFNRMAEQLQASHAQLERKVHERTAELERVNGQLARASEAKSAFLATMSHELRTPLNAIIGFADLLSDPAFGRVEARTTRDLSSNILASGRHLLTLINDVLDLARVEAGKIEISPEPTDLGAVVGEVLSVVRPLADEKRLALGIEGSIGVPAVQADPARLRQVLFNLVANAIKFTPDRGRVTLRIEDGPAEVTVRVIDNGPGLVPGEAEKIFEPFERGKASRKAEGAGLGLALARHLVELQGGRIGAQGRPGKGATFWFTIPLATERARRTSQEVAIAR